MATAELDARAMARHKLNHVNTRLDQAIREQVASVLNMSKETYISESVASSMRQLPAHLQHAQAREDAALLAEQSWNVAAAPVADAWRTSAAHRQTIDLAMQEWDSANLPHATALSSVDALVSPFAQLSSDDASGSAASPSEVVRGKRRADPDIEPSANKRGKMRAQTPEKAESLPYASPGSQSDQDSGWEVAPEDYGNIGHIGHIFAQGQGPHGAGPARRAQTASPEPATPDDAAAQQAPGIPPSREGSVEELIKKTITNAQKAKISKQHSRFLARFTAGLNELNKKAGRSQIDPEQALNRYKVQSQQKKPSPLERKAQEAKLAEKALGVGATPTEYLKHRKAELAKKMGVGSTSAAYESNQKAKRAEKTLGVGATGADLKKHDKAERAKKLGVGTTAADYDNYRGAELAKKLGVGFTAADYVKHRKAERKKQADKKTQESNESDESET